ncbi:MAG: hypothetical protein Q8K22_07280 [Rhodoferax sp.]|nr:hypothetical protein [Rhodoferax sp.]
MRDADGSMIRPPLTPATVLLAERAMFEELADQELNRKVLERMGECTQAVEVDIDDI